jgi:hypothetical protein
MKKMYVAFENLFGGGRFFAPTSQTSSPVTITSFSQPEVLRRRMEEEKMSHGGRVTANLSPVRLDMDHGGVVMYFCPMRTIEVLNIKTEGDGGGIPQEARVEGLRVPGGLRSGYYDLQNVELTSNGTMLVKATEATCWEMVEMGFPD